MDNSPLQDKTIFDRIDAAASSFSAFGFSPFNVLTNIKIWRKYIAVLVIASALLWVLLGFDSTWEVAEIFIMSFAANPASFVQNFLGNTPDFQILSAEAFATYGMGNHWSAPVIYGLLFIGVSYALENRGYKKSANFILTSLISFGAIGSFEVPWNFFYATFQHQAWAFDFFHMKQMALTIFYSTVLILGILAFLYLLSDGFKIKFGALQVSALCLAVFFWIFWINYPFQTYQPTYWVSGGAWTASKLFPQTYYVIDVNPLDNISSGMPHYVQNDLLHAINTITKVFQTFFIYTICLVEAKKS